MMLRTEMNRGHGWELGAEGTDVDGAHRSNPVSQCADRRHRGRARRLTGRAAGRSHDRSDSQRGHGPRPRAGHCAFPHNSWLGATRKHLAWPSAMETATPSDLPFAAADTASGERWISLRELAEQGFAALGNPACSPQRPAGEGQGFAGGDFCDGGGLH
jgi:hypothetical protein